MCVKEGGVYPGSTCTWLGPPPIDYVMSPWNNAFSNKSGSVLSFSITLNVDLASTMISHITSSKSVLR